VQIKPRFKSRQRRGYERLNIVITILLAGWVPSILTLVISYTILTNTLESKILRDRQTFVQLIAHSVGEDLGRTGGIIEYYQTQPALGKILTSPAPEPLAQEWLRDTFFSHPLIDGMFLTSFDGRLVGALPYDQEMIGRDYRSKSWLDGASASPDVFVASVHPRSPDNRKATEIVGAVRGRMEKSSALSAFRFWSNGSGGVCLRSSLPINRSARFSIRMALHFSRKTSTQIPARCQPPASS